MAETAADGARREETISRADEVRKRLEGGATAASGATKPEDKPSDEASKPKAELSDSTQVVEEEHEEPGADDGDQDVIEYEADGEKRRLDWKAIRGDPEARRVFVEQLQRGAAAPRPEVDEEEIVACARRLQITADIDRGLLRVNPATGALEETALARKLRDGTADDDALSAPTTEGADHLAWLKPEEAAEYRRLRQAGIDGDVAAFAKSDGYVALSLRRSLERTMREAERRTTALLTEREKAHRSDRSVDRNRAIVEAELDRFGEVFKDPVKRQIARNQVATMLELHEVTDVSARVRSKQGGVTTPLAAIAVVARSYGGAASAAKPPTTGQQQTRTGSGAPPAVGKGSRVPPGPPPGTKAGEPKAGSGDPTKPKRLTIGSSEMVAAVAERLRALAS